MGNPIFSKTLSINIQEDGKMPMHKLEVSYFMKTGYNLLAYIVINTPKKTANY